MWFVSLIKCGNVFEDHQVWCDVKKQVWKGGLGTCFEGGFDHNHWNTWSCSISLQFVSTHVTQEFMGEKDLKKLWTMGMVVTNIYIC
jgi:hypothetical protein